MTLTDKAVEAGARALCLHAGDDPDRLTYAREMNCTGRDREPMYRWRYWVGFAEACLSALAAEGLVVVPICDFPDFEDVRGMAPDATGELSSEEFVRRLRDEWGAP